MHALVVRSLQLLQLILPLQKDRALLLSSVDSLNASGVAKTLGGFFIALSMSIQTYDSTLATLGSIIHGGACDGLSIVVKRVRDSRGKINR